MKYRLAGTAVLDAAERTYMLERSLYPDLRLSRITFGMDKARSLTERYRLTHPLPKRVLADTGAGRGTGSGYRGGADTLCYGTRRGFVGSA